MPLALSHTHQQQLYSNYPQNLQWWFTKQISHSLLYYYVILFLTSPFCRFCSQPRSRSNGRYWNDWKKNDSSPKAVFTGRMLLCWWPTCCLIQQLTSQKQNWSGLFLRHHFFIVCVTIFKLFGSEMNPYMCRDVSQPGSCPGPALTKEVQESDRIVVAQFSDLSPTELIANLGFIWHSLL